MLTAADDLLAPENLRDPFPALARLRSEDPVHWNPLFRAWMLTRHDDVRAALREAGAFASNDRENWDLLAARFAEPDRSAALEWLPLTTRILVGQDAPTHPRLRALVSKALTPRFMASLQTSAERHCAALANSLERQREFDLAGQFAEPLTWSVLLDMVAIPPQGIAMVRSWAAAHRQFVSALLARDEAILRNAVPTLLAEREWLARLIAERRSSPGHDLVSALAQAEHQGDTLTDGEIFEVVHFFLLVAGHETTASLVAIGALELLRHPTEWLRLRRDPSLVRGAVKELMRFVSPAFLLRRIVRSGVVLRGRTLRVGDSAFLMIGAANRDPEVFDNPDALDVTRNNAHSLALGLGPHACLGGLLAQIEAETALSTLLRRFAELALAGEVEFEPACVVRRPKRIPVRQW